MKVGTDAVLLGAWAFCENETRILDIGTGTGILSLMLAQRNDKIEIDALEINTEAALLAKQNVMLSPWRERINIYQISFQEFVINTQARYSLIICNPPFFTKSLKANSEARNLARHNDSLPINELLAGVAKLLTSHGKAIFIFPYDSLEKWKTEAEKFLLFPSAITLVKSSPAHFPHRAMVSFTKERKNEVVENAICINSHQDTYSQEYQQLTSPYYLKF